MLLMSSLKIMEIHIPDTARFYNRLTLIILGIFTLQILNGPQQDQKLTETSPQVVTCLWELMTSTMITFQCICQLSRQELELTRTSKMLSKTLYCQKKLKLLVTATQTNQWKIKTIRRAIMECYLFRIIQSLLLYLRQRLPIHLHQT